MATFRWTDGSRAAALERLTAEVATEWSERVGPAGVTIMQSEAPMRTGGLRQSHRSELVRKGRRYFLRWTADAKNEDGEPYGAVVHEGRGPVFAKNAKALRFFAEVGGAPVFRKSVGPAAANRWMVRSLKRMGMRDVRSTDKAVR